MFFSFDTIYYYAFLFRNILLCSGGDYPNVNAVLKPRTQWTKYDKLDLFFKLEHVFGSVYEKKNKRFISVYNQLNVDFRSLYDVQVVCVGTFVEQ